jgi:plastocyanin
MTSTTTKTSKKYLALVGAAVAAGVLLLSTVAGTISISSAQAQGQGQEQQQQADSQAQNDTTMVAAGDGGPESVLIAFIPKNVTIDAGETVVWTNPTVVGEPHTVSFIRQPARLLCRHRITLSDCKWHRTNPCKS